VSAPAPRREDGEPGTRPTRRAQAAGPRRWPTPARGAGLVLVVDDTSDTRELYALYFQSRGFSVITAADGEAGVETALRYEPDVIVMDLAMPRLDGVAATQRLRQDARTRHTPIIILTGYQVQAMPLGTSEAGADALLTKPCLPEDLERSVRELLPSEA
jgi:two-component system cell cycle response regulator DivK